LNFYRLWSRSEFLLLLIFSVYGSWAYTHSVTHSLRPSKYPIPRLCLDFSRIIRLGQIFQFTYRGLCCGSIVDHFREHKCDQRLLQLRAEAKILQYITRCDIYHRTSLVLNSEAQHQYIVEIPDIVSALLFPVHGCDIHHL
jgi:hypothetical protein